MKDWSTLEGSAQKEALLNELKGNIFEFLLGSQMARRFGHEGEFLQHFTSLDGGKVHQDFNRYQSYLLEHDRELYLKLPRIAEEAKDFLEKSDFFKNFKPIHTHLMGKWASSFNEGDDLKESDLVFVNNLGKSKGLSLKLCKTGAFVNTKSGGIRSFIEKYFGDFIESIALQADLNNYLDHSFGEMRDACYQWADLEFHTQGPTSKAQFDEQWQQAGHPVLPGQLPEDLKPILHAHYQRMIAKLYQALGVLWNKDKEKFALCLLPIVGLGSKEISQLTCFHKSSKEERYLVDHFEYFNREEFYASLSDLDWPELKQGVSSFELRLGMKTLQIRVKPMNTFIVSGLKINCSVKSHKKK